MLMTRAASTVEASQALRIPLTALRNADGQPLAAAAAAGKFGLTSGGYGAGGLKLEGEAASGNTKTSTFLGSYPVPQNFEAASACIVRVGARVTTPPATSAQLACQVYKSDGQGGVVGSNLVTSGAATLTGTWGDKDFIVNPSSLLPGDELVVFGQAVVDDTTGATGAKAQVGSVKAVVSTRM